MQLNLREFVKLVDSAFSQTMESFGFKPAGKRGESDWYCSRSFRSDDRYIEISASCHQRDGSPECRVVLGVGSSEWPDCDWNGVALWRLREETSNYPLPSVEDLGEILARMRNDLIEGAPDFLKGDTTRFQQALSNQNRGREPYKMYTRQPDGSIQISIDAISEALKKRSS